MWVISCAQADLSVLKPNKGVNRNAVIHINLLNMTLAANSLAMTPPQGFQSLGCYVLKSQRSGENVLKPYPMLVLNQQKIHHDSCCDWLSSFKVMKSVWSYGASSNSMNPTKGMLSLVQIGRQNNKYIAIHDHLGACF